MANKKKEQNISYELTKKNSSTVNGYEISKYLPSDLSPELIDRLAEELSPLTCEGFMRDCVTPELVADVSSHLKVADRLVVARKDNQPVAFITTSMHNFVSVSGTNELIYHLEGIIVKPECQGTGLSKLLVSQDVKDSGATYLGFHTQNGRMKSLGMKIAYINDLDSSIYGHIIDTHRQEGTRDVGRYGSSSLYGNLDKFSSTAVNEIDWRNGDAIVCIGPIRNEILR